MIRPIATSFAPGLDEKLKAKLPSASVTRKVQSLGESSHAEPKGEALWGLLDPAPAGVGPEDKADAPSKESCKAELAEKDKAPPHHVPAEEEEPKETPVKDPSPEPDSFPADLEDLPDYDEEVDSAHTSEGEVTPLSTQDAVPAIDASVFALLEKDGDFTAQSVKDRVKSFEAMVKKKEEMQKAPLTAEERLKLASHFQ